MKYTVINPETEQRLATVDHLSTPGGSTWELQLGLSGGRDAKLRLEDTELGLRAGMLEVTAGGARQVFPAFCARLDGSLVVATALGNFKLLATRGAVTEEGPGARSATRSVKSSMPGKVLKVLVQPGEKVEAGQPLLIIEAMKMENEIRSPSSGVIENVPVQVGQKIETGELLVKLGAENG